MVFTLDAPQRRASKCPISLVPFDVKSATIDFARTLRSVLPSAGHLNFDFAQHSRAPRPSVSDGASFFCLVLFYSERMVDVSPYLLIKAQRVGNFRNVAAHFRKND